VSFLTGELNHGVYGAGEVTMAAADFLNRNSEASIRVLAEMDIPEDNLFLTALTAAALRDRVKILVVPPDLMKSHDYHFAVGDGKHFRFEPQRSAMKAIVRFGDANVGGRLQQIFDRLYTRLAAAQHQKG
jgi:hypothetical protein